jgi:exodeoxyribonuclease III
MRLVTWNVNSLRVRLPQLLDWLKQHRPDVVCLQETKVTDADFPSAALREAGYESVFAGQKTYNGVAILSRRPAEAVMTALPGVSGEQKRFIAATFDGVRVVNVYVPNGESVESEKYSYKLDWLRRFEEYLSAELPVYPKLVAVGDFNIAPEYRDVYDPDAWRGHVLFSDPERDAFRRLLKAGLVDVFRRFPQPEGSFSWWDYRQAAFRRNLGLRIDHVLASEQLVESAKSCNVDTEPRRAERPSDHAPVMADFAL